MKFSFDAAFLKLSDLEIEKLATLETDIKI